MNVNILRKKLQKNALEIEQNNHTETFHGFV